MRRTRTDASLDVVRHCHGVLITGAEFYSIRAAAFEAERDDITFRQFEALSRGRIWTEPDGYETAVLPNTSPRAAFTNAFREAAYEQWIEQKRGRSHRSVSNRIGDSEPILVTLLHHGEKLNGTSAEFTIEEFLQLAQLSDVEAFELRADLLQEGESVIGREGIPAYRVQILQPFPKSRNQAGNDVRDRFRS